MSEIHTKRTGTVTQGTVLSFLSMLSVAAALLIAPVLPKIIEAYATDPMVQAKVILLLTIPALVVAFSAPFLGRLVERAGRKPVLLVSLVFYMVFGLAPPVLNDLNLIIASRALVGLAEAGIMTASTTLIGDYFTGQRREHWFVVQTSTASVAAVVLTLVGGLLGEYGWKAPFVIYALPLLFIPFVAFLIHEPSHAPHQGDSAAFPWARILPLYLMALIVAILFFIVPIQTPFALNALGVTSSQTIGIASALGGTAVPVGGLLFKRLSRYGFFANMSLAFVLIAAGLMLFASGINLPVVIAGIVVTGLGCGITLPAVVVAIMEALAFNQRGRGTGGWQTAFFLGNFLSPVLILGLSARTGGLAITLRDIALISALLFVAMALAGMAHAGRKAKTRVYVFPKQGSKP